jgi:hypothetical protein
VVATFHLRFILEIVNEENHKTPEEMRMAAPEVTLTIQ